MAGLCATVGNFAGLFLLLAAVAALLETGLLVTTAWRALKEARIPKAEISATDAEGAAKVLEALKGVLLALKGLPAWISLFLAGLALVWTAAAAPKLCPCPDESACRPAFAGK